MLDLITGSGFITLSIAPFVFLAWAENSIKYFVDITSPAVIALVVLSAVNMVLGWVLFYKGAKTLLERG